MAGNPAENDTLLGMMEEESARQRVGMWKAAVEKPTTPVDEMTEQFRKATLGTDR